MNMSRCRGFTLTLAGLLVASLGACGGGSSSPATPPPPTTFTVGGNVTGLTGTGLVLQNNNGDDLSIAANGAFTFASPLLSGGAYVITVKTQPAVPAGQFPQTCDVSSGSGNATSIVRAIAVGCHGPSGRFLYVVNSGSDNVSAYSIDGSSGTLTPVAGSPFAGTGPSPRTAALHPNGRFLYVPGFTSTLTSGSIAGFNIDASTGALTSIPGLPLTFPGAASRISFHPNGNFLYFHIQTGVDAGIHAYAIDATTGALSLVPGSPIPLQLNGGVLDATGDFYYSASIAPPTSVRAYSVNSTTGALTQVHQLAVTQTPSSFAIDPSGKFLYVSLTSLLSANYIAGYSLNTTTGLGAEIAGSPLIASQNPTSLLFGPQGRLYAANSGTSGSPPVNGPGSISVFTPNSTSGALVNLAGSPYSSGGNRIDLVTFDPTGRFLSATNIAPGRIALFTIHSTDGELTPVLGSPFSPSTGINPGVLKFDPSGRFGYVTDTNTNTVSLYSIDSTGRPTFISSYQTGATPSISAPIIAGQQ